jgi:hypothetical protein
MKITLKNFIPHRHMQFAPVEEDDDDLSNLIKADSDTHEDNWKLTDDLDGAKLEAFWDDALKELGSADAEKD